MGAKLMETVTFQDGIRVSEVFEQCAQEANNHKHPISLIMASGNNYVFLPNMNDGELHYLRRLMAAQGDTR